MCRDGTAHRAPQFIDVRAPQLQVPTDVLLRMMDGGAKKLKQSTVENLLQLSLPQVPVSALRVAYQCCGVTASSKRCDLSWGSQVLTCRAKRFVQALKKWDSVAINESMHIDSPIEDLVAVFDEKKPLTYQVGIDIAPTVSWKSPYQDIAVSCTHGTCLQSALRADRVNKTLAHVAIARNLGAECASYSPHLAGTLYAMLHQEVVARRHCAHGNHN